MEAVNSSPTEVLLQLRLDMHVPEFVPRQEQFLSELAEYLHVDASKIAIVSVLVGCTYLVLKLDPETARLLMEDYKGENGGDRSPVLKALISSYNVRSLRAADDVQAAFIRELLDEDHVGPDFTWVHLSDLHLRSEEGAAKYAQKILLDQLKSDLPQLLRERNLQPDALFFTGDLAFSGASQEYTGVKNFLEDLLAMFEKKPQLFFVPGNHDIQWDSIDPDEIKALRKQLSTRYSVEEFLLEPKNHSERDRVFRKLSNFSAFASGCSLLGQPEINHGYFYTHAITKDELKIGIAGLNSAWFCTSKKNASVDVDLDLGHLFIGRHQLLTVTQALAECDIRFALVHHPPMTAWFNDDDHHDQSRYLRTFDFILRGHEHREEPTKIAFLETADEAYNFAGGALYQWGKTPLSLSLGRLDFGSGWVSSYFINFSHKHDRWLFDSHPQWPFGRIPLAFPSGARQRLSEKQFSANLVTARPKSVTEASSRQEMSPVLTQKHP
jgi:predicted phosphodiesterase